MPKTNLTPEQVQVVRHPIGNHARVLAVAGSGKSSTMAHRIRYLVQDCAVRPGEIQVLMFNSLARKQFSNHLNQAGLPESLQPAVHTFHSFSFKVINQCIKSGLYPASTQFWLADKTELIWLTVKRSITNLERAKRLSAEAVDPEEALSAISLWKGSLIPPDRAGSHASPDLPLVYQEFEHMREEANALTFDDFIPLAIQLLESIPSLASQYTQPAHLIVDEYQDINYGQERLIELLAGEQADVMVVGDDDQTIYEFRGARPKYILQDFPRVFDNKPVLDYRLSRSFRFGPLIAQCAANVIACNLTRLDKPLIAFQSGKPGFVTVLDGGYDSAKALTEQILSLIQADKTPPSEIIVLARMFAQLDHLETEFLQREIPYRVDGQEPFFKRPEINTLLNYFRLAMDYQKPFHHDSAAWFLNVANKPSRMLSHAVLSRLADTAKYRRMSPQQILEWAVDEPSFKLSTHQVEKLSDLGGFLETLHHFMSDFDYKAGALLDWMVTVLRYLDYFLDYYGKGEHADEKKYAVINFIRYVTQMDVTPQKLLAHLAKIDTTQGKPDDEIIVFTTIFRTKGLEYDYVVLPQCDDNLLPYLKGESHDLFDKAGLVQECELSSKLESERRLFYVALTRARKGVLIGASEKPSRFIDETRLAETDTIMNAVTHLAAGDQGASNILRQALRSPYLAPTLMNNLLYGYLPDLGQTQLAQQLANVR